MKEVVVACLGEGLVGQPVVGQSILCQLLWEAGQLCRLCAFSLYYLGCVRVDEQFSAAVGSLGNSLWPSNHSPCWSFHSAVGEGPHSLSWFAPAAGDCF